MPNQLRSLAGFLMYIYLYILYRRFFYVLHILCKFTVYTQSTNKSIRHNTGKSHRLELAEICTFTCAENTRKTRHYKATDSGNSLLFSESDVQNLDINARWDYISRPLCGAFGNIIAISKIELTN